MERDCISEPGATPVGRSMGAAAVADLTTSERGRRVHGLHAPSYRMAELRRVVALAVDPKEEG